MSDFIPNSFQVPNAYIDRVWHLLAPQEQSVLIYMARRIFGFRKRQDRVSLFQFTEGTRSSKDGRVLDGGTGLSRDCVRKCLKNLKAFKLVEEIAPATAKEGPLFSLQLNSDEIDLDGLEARKAAGEEAARRKAFNANEARREGGRGNVAHYPWGNVPHYPQYTGETQRGLKMKKVSSPPGSSDYVTTPEPENFNDASLFGDELSTTP